MKHVGRRDKRNMIALLNHLLLLCSKYNVNDNCHKFAIYFSTLELHTHLKCISCCCVLSYWYIYHHVICVHLYILSDSLLENVFMLTEASDTSLAALSALQHVSGRVYVVRRGIGCQTAIVSILECLHTYVTLYSCLRADIRIWETLLRPGRTNLQFYTHCSKKTYSTRALCVCVLLCLT